MNRTKNRKKTCKDDLEFIPIPKNLNPKQRSEFLALLVGLKSEIEKTIAELYNF